MDIEEAASRYKRSSKHAHNLIELHQRSGQGKRGRRHLEHSLNRAVVVTMVATWQATVQDLVHTLLDFAPPAASDPHRHHHLMVIAGIRERVGKFATPNAEKSRDLLKAAGFDPRPLWTWETRPGRANSQRWSPADVDRRMNQWLKLRHAIAHGDEELPAVDALTVVRNPSRGGKNGKPQIWLPDAIDCVDFFHRVVVATGDGVATHLGVPAPFWE